jgi:two-component system OmpR family sensor kinase
VNTFGEFAGRITRGYVALACALIVLVVLVTTLLAFLLYAGTLEEATNATAQRAADIATAAHASHRTLAQAAAQLGALGHERVAVFVFDDAHRRLAGHPQPPSFASEMLEPVASLFGVHRTIVHVPGGTVIVDPQLSRFVWLLGWYWSIVLPVGALAVLVAWLAGRNLTRRALDPLERVTRALRAIAAGDFQPEPLRNGGSELSALTGAYNDVAFRLTAATVQHREDEARIRRFIADAGHELRTPLTVIMGYLDVLSRGVVREEDAIARIHETMRHESHRMRVVIEKLILLARLDRPPALPQTIVDVGVLVRRAVAELATAGSDRVSVEAQDGATVRGEESEIYEAIKNVIDNALRYAPDAPVSVRVAREGETVEVTVADRGPGIAPEDVAHVFERFYRGRERYSTEGSGLGLAIAKSAVERIGGSVALESDEAGTRVTLRLPYGA